MYMNCFSNNFKDLHLILTPEKKMVRNTTTMIKLLILPYGFPKIMQLTFDGLKNLQRLWYKCKMQLICVDLPKFSM